MSNPVINIIANPEDLADIKINYNNIPNIVAPRNAVKVLVGREGNPVYYNPIDVDTSFTEERLKVADKSFLPGDINIYSDIIYDRLRDSNKQVCENLRDVGNKPKKNFTPEPVTICNSDINNLKKDDDNLLKQWVSLINKSLTAIENESKKNVKMQEAITKDVNLLKRMRYRQDNCLNAYINNQKSIDVINTEKAKSLSILKDLKNALRTSVIKIDFDYWNKHNDTIGDLFDKKKGVLEKPKIESEKAGKEGDILERKVKKGQNELNAKIKLIQHLQEKLEKKGLNLTKLKARINTQIGVFNKVKVAPAAGGSSSKARKRKSKKSKKVKKRVVRKRKKRRSRK